MTDTFIAMCAAATEIQAAWKPKAGDWISNNGASPFLWCGEPIGQAKDYIWCPRIEDMVGMIGVERLEKTYSIEFSWTEETTIIMYAHADQNMDSYDWRAESDSLESVWLQYVMYKLYDKKWRVVFSSEVRSRRRDGAEWIPTVEEWGWIKRGIPNG